MMITHEMITNELINDDDDDDGGEEREVGITIERDNEETRRTLLFASAPLFFANQPGYFDIHTSMIC